MYERSFFPQPSLKSTVEDILTALVFTSLHFSSVNSPFVGTQLGRVRVCV